MALTVQLTALIRAGVKPRGSVWRFPSLCGELCVSDPGVTIVLEQTKRKRGMAVSISEVNVVEQPGLYRVESSSSTVYYVDTRSGGLHFMRARGTGNTGTGSSDDAWVEMSDLQSGPPEEKEGEEIAEAEIDLNNVVKNVLRVGSRHRYFWQREWWTQRVCTRIEALERMPAREAITKEEELA